jgi:AcrR family transcriptional regulator
MAQKCASRLVGAGGCPIGVVSEHVQEAGFLSGEEPRMAEAASDQRVLTQSRKSAKKRDVILRAAIEVINAKSFALASMSEIAAGLDLSNAALYYYFPNKQALVYACHLSSLERFERLLSETDAAGGTGAVKLECFLRSLLNDSARNGPQLYFGDHSYLEAPQREIVDAWGDRLKVRLEAFLQQGMADGSIVPCEPGLVVHLLLGMLIWLGKWVPTIEDLTVDRLMAAMGVVSLTGLLTSEPQSE